MKALNGQTINGVSMTLPQLGMTPFSTGSMPGTAVSGGGANPTYDGLMAIWDAYNGSGTGTGVPGEPTGWNNFTYWSATPSPSGYANVNLGGGYVNDYKDSALYLSYAAYQVL